MPYKYTKELHEQWRKDSGDWKNSFHPDAIVTLLDEIERLQKEIFDIKNPKYTLDVAVYYDDFDDCSDCDAIDNPSCSHCIGC
jgi:hypothetical protein